MLHRAWWRCCQTINDTLTAIIKLAAMAKLSAARTAVAVASEAVQLMGGYGYSKAYPIEQKMRDGWGWGIAGGTIDIQKVVSNNTAAKLSSPTKVELPMIL